MNYYVILGVPHDADTDTIRSAFRALARRYHPDAGEGASADRFREVLAAYETLSHPARRGQYDRILRAARPAVAQFVEPLRPDAAPEPMLRPRHGEEIHPRYDSRRPAHVIDLIDELIQSWDELTFGDPRRRGRV